MRLAEERGLAAIALRPSSAVRIVVSKAEIVIELGFDAVLLRAVVRAMSELE